MLQLDENVRNQIVNYLEGAVVPAVVGANLIQITNALKDLKSIEEKVILTGT